MRRCDATTPTDGCGSSKPRKHLGICSKTTIPFLFTSSYSMLFYVILCYSWRYPTKTSVFLYVSSAFSKKHMGFSWLFHRFPPFLGQIFSTWPSNGSTGRPPPADCPSTPPKSGPFFSAEMGHPWDFFGFSPGFLGILACFFSDFPGKWHGNG